MEKTWMPKVAGILDIVVGSFNLAYIFIVWPLWFRSLSAFLTSNNVNSGDFPIPILPFMTIILILAAMLIIPASILAIVGGTYARRRKKWRMALAGSIGALFGLLAPFGIAAIVFTAMSKSEFE
jgi:uncharacterized membrane protein HdeD (DUF308 family)